MRQPLRIFFGTKTTVAVPSPMAKTPPKRQEGSIPRSAPFPRGAAVAAFSEGKVPAGILRWGRPGKRRGENRGEEEGQPWQGSFPTCRSSPALAAALGTKLRGRSCPAQGMTLEAAAGLWGRQGEPGKREERVGKYRDLQ